MTRSRLSAFDASFLAVETPTAHMHVGFVATFTPPDDCPLPTFAELRDHIGTRLMRAPRYRQKLAQVPLGLRAAEWVDDEGFSVDRHVYRARGPLGDLVDEVMSVPLRRDRPLWEMWICEEQDRESFAIVGKVHHCMIDGAAAIELTSMLLDPTPEPPACEADTWQAAPAPSSEQLLAAGRPRSRRRAARPRSGLAARGDLTHSRGEAGAHRRRARHARRRTFAARGPREPPQPADLAAALPRVDGAPARRPAAREALVRHDRQRRSARGRRGRDAHVHDPPSRGAGIAEGHGAGERAQLERGPRARQPDLVRIRRSPVRGAAADRSPLSGARLDDAAQARRRAGGRRPRVQGRRSRAGRRAARGLASRREPPHLQPRRLERPGAASAPVHARVPAADASTPWFRWPSGMRSRSA